MTTQAEIKEKDTQTPKCIILVDKDKPQFFEFDKAMVFNEKPINKKIAVELLMNDGSTVQVETSALSLDKIRVVCPKGIIFIEGDTLDINFTGIYEKKPKPFFLNIPCQFEKVENFKQITHVTIAFNEQADSAFIQWYHKWINKSRTENKKDSIDNKAFSFIYQFYKRLYCDHLPYPVLFSNVQQLGHAFVSKAGLGSITFIDDNGVNRSIPASTFQPFIHNPETINRTPLFVWLENNQIYYFSTADYPKTSPKEMIAWLTRKPAWRVLLIRNQKMVSVDQLQQEELAQFFTKEMLSHSPEDSSHFDSQTICTHIIDISSVFTQVNFPRSEASFEGKQLSFAEHKINYHSLAFKIKRSEPRYDYSTTISVTAENLSGSGSIKAETINISFLGLQVKLNSSEDIFKENDWLNIEFTQWKEMADKGGFLKKKEDSPVIACLYKIINIEQQDDGIIVDLLRVKRDADPKVNSEIKNKIEEIGQAVSGQVKNDIDLYKSLSASPWINNNIPGLVFYLGRDSEGTRIIQAIANTEENIKLRRPYLEQNDWSFLQTHALSLGIEVNNVRADSNIPFKKLNVGIYCYYDDQAEKPEWKSKTDLNFKTVEDKRNFIRLAIQFKKHYFYHCSVIPIKSGKDEILNDESSALVSIGPNRLKKIHDICRSLIAIGELNDVTRLIEFIYKSR